MEKNQPTTTNASTESATATSAEDFRTMAQLARPAGTPAAKSSQGGVEDSKDMNNPVTPKLRAIQMAGNSRMPVRTLNQIGALPRQTLSTM